jgi:hypothetical protein
VRSITLDGVAIDPDAIPMYDDNQTHDVVVQLGEPAARAVSSSAAAAAGIRRR